MAAASVSGLLLWFEESSAGDSVSFSLRERMSLPRLRNSTETTNGAWGSRLNIIAERKTMDVSCRSRYRLA